MLTYLELKVLAGFFPYPKNCLIKDLKKKSSYSYERVYSALKSLEKQEIVFKKRVGKVLTYDLDADKKEALLSFVFYMTNKLSKFEEKYKKATSALNELVEKTDIVCLVVFGSYAKLVASKDSDVDILCISDQENMERAALSLRHKYGLRINPVIVKKDDFKNIKLENPEFYRDLVEYGVVLKGFEKFYELVYR